MGTLHEWLQVLIAGTIWGGAMGFGGSGGRLLAKPPRLYLRLNVLFYVLNGLCFGIGLTFGDQAFRPPLVFLSTVIFGSTLILLLLIRRLFQNEPRIPLYSPDAPVFGRTEQKHDSNRLN